MGKPRGEIRAGELAYLDMLLDNAIARCMHAYREAFEFINNISDSQLRQILRLRYLDDLTWYKVARGIGEHDEQYPRKKHDRLLKTLKCEEESP